MHEKCRKHATVSNEQTERKGSRRPANQNTDNCLTNQCRRRILRYTLCAKPREGIFRKQISKERDGVEVLALHVTARVPTQAVTYGRLLPCGLTTLNPCCLSALVTVSQPHMQRRHVQVTVPVQSCHAERAHPFPSPRRCRT